MWICHVANSSPLPSSPTCDQVIVSHNQEIAELRPRLINTSIDQEARHNHDSENATLCHETHSGEPSPEAVVLSHSSNEAPYRRPCPSPNTMSIQHLVHDNNFGENPETSDVQPSASQLAVDINIRHSSSNQELPQPSVTTPGSVEGEENGGEGEGEVNGDEGEKDGVEGEKSGGEGEKSGVEGEENGVEGEENGKTRDEREKEQEIEAEGGEQEDDDDEENNDEAQQEKNDTHNDEKAKASVQRKETIDNMRVRGKKAIFPTEQSTARVSKRGSKRKSKVQEVVDDRSKRSKTRASTPMTDIASLKCLEHIPKSSIQPAEVYKIFLDRSQSEDQNGIWFMTRLFFAIASPDAFYQLRDTCTSIREDGASTILQPTNSIAQTIQALDNLEIAASTNSILRRYHLIAFV